MSNSTFGHDEQIRMVVVDDPFTIENRLLTSQRKPRRKEIEQRYQDEINDTKGGLHAN